MRKLRALLATAAIAPSLMLANGYNNLFVSYISPQDVSTLSNYVNSQNLAGYIMWEVKGDVNPVTDSEHSLLAPLQADAQGGKQVQAYWTNWSVYSTSKPYPLPGSKSSQTGSTATNDDLEQKLNIITHLVYSFLEVQTSGNHVGSLYFNDSWSDLDPSDEFCSDSATASICSYGLASGRSIRDSAYMGNFEAFSQLRNSHPNLKLVFAVGGAGHDASIESAFSSEQAMNNFADSAIAIMDHYGIQGIDLDYENTSMTHAQSQQFLQLTQVLSAKLKDGQFFNVTVLASPTYLNGISGGSAGFDSGVLASIQALPHFGTLNLMTYDFHGAFDYSSNGTGRTGFLSNVYDVTGTPAGYNAQFSVKSTVQALLDQGIPADKINVGIPAYGRALAGIPAGEDGTGLFQVIPSSATIPVGDLDDSNCATGLPIGSNSCSGSFSYSYIANHFLTGPFTVTNWSNNANEATHATTAYAQTWDSAAAAATATSSENHTLEVSNIGPDYGIVVTVGGINLDYLSNNGGSKSYNNDSNVSLGSIQGQTGLDVSWSTWAGGPAGSCGKLDLTSNQHIMINASSGACEIKTF